jgi:hypothetical protein
MTTKYVPQSDIGFDQWLETFTNYVAGHYVQLGVSAADKDTMIARNQFWGVRYQAHINALAAARGAKEEKDTSRQSAEEFARYLAQRIQTSSGTTDTDREALGITVADEEPTPLPEDVVLTTAPPMLFIDHSQPRIAIVHFGLNPQNEKENAKPIGMSGVKLWFHIGGIPEDGGQWEFLADDTNSPYNHIVNNDTTVTIAYRGQWFDKRLRLGPLGDPVVAAITP